MNRILHIDSSPRGLNHPIDSYNSISKKMAADFMSQWQQKNPEDQITYRNLSNNPPPFITQDWIAAVFTDTEKLTQSQKELIHISDQLIAELEQADLLVISSPMYNYGMPAILKAWFDQIIRIHKTFSFDLARGDFPLAPILSGKTLVLLTSCGEFGFEVGGIRATSDHLTPHIKLLSKYLGVAHFYTISIEYQEFTDHRHQLSLAQAQQKIKDLVDHLN